MATLAEEIAEKIISECDTEEVVFARSDIVDNMLQLIYEQKLEAEDVGKFVADNAPDDQQRKILVKYANDLIAYLNQKLTKTKLSGFRGQPQFQKKEEKQKLSKSEQYLERKRKEKEEKERKEKLKKSEGKIEKISLKDVGKEMEEEIKKQEELDKKIKTTQEDTQLEHERHVAAYQSAFELYAYVVSHIDNPDGDTDDLCTLIVKMGDAEITSRQAALDRMKKNQYRNLAQDALIAALKDRNIIINVLSVLGEAGDKRAIPALLNVIKEYPTENDILFRGPALAAIGNIVARMNKEKKNSGIKLIYSMTKRPDFEKKIKLLTKVLKRDISNKQYRAEYFTPYCFKWLAFVTEKVYESKKKTVKVAFVNVAMQTDESKDLKELLELLQSL